MQLFLGRGEVERVVDTLVMANLGYFQLKAAPGLWRLQLAPGPSQDLYSVQSALDQHSQHRSQAGPGCVTDISVQGCRVVQGLQLALGPPRTCTACTARWTMNPGEKPQCIHEVPGLVAPADVASEDSLPL